VNKDEIARLKWSGRCAECARPMALVGNAAFAVLVNKLQPPSCNACSWEKHDRAMLEAIEADTNLLGLADYIEKLRSAASAKTKKDLLDLVNQPSRYPLCPHDILICFPRHEGHIYCECCKGWLGPPPVEHKRCSSCRDQKA